MISKLHLHNFKCFEDQGFGVGPLTVLSGLNGMGKSTVLQAMLLLRQSFEQGLLQKTGLALNGEYVKVGTAKDALFEDAADDSLALTLGYGDQLEAKWSFSYDAAADVMGRTSGTGEEGVFAEPLFGTGFTTWRLSERDRGFYSRRQTTMLGVCGKLGPKASTPHTS